MSPLSLHEKLQQKLYLKEYLKELSALAGQTVRADDLGSLEHAAAMRMNAKKSDVKATVVYKASFSDRSSERFKKFLRGLKDANSSAIYIWTPRTISCGALLAPSLNAINFDFDFNINDEGILAFTTSDLEDRLLLDFSSTPTGEQVMNIEIQGTNWPTVSY